MRLYCSIPRLGIIRYFSVRYLRIVSHKIFSIADNTLLDAGPPEGQGQAAGARERVAEERQPRHAGPGEQAQGGAAGDQAVDEACL